MKGLFLTVVGVSISVSLITLILLVLSSFLNKRFSAKWKYLIWIAIAMRLVIPFNFRMPVQKIVVDVPTQITVPINVIAGNAENTSDERNISKISNISNIRNSMPFMLQFDYKTAQISLLDIAACLWLVGCLLFLSVHIISYLHFRKQIVRDGETIEDDRILSLICRLSGELRIKPDIQVIKYSGAGSPMIVGFFKPLLMLPDERFSEEELNFILKHELIHLKRHDVSFKLLFVVANAIHWFNPLVYFMRKEAEIDMELSCDERVLQKASHAVQEAYTETLLSTLSRQYKSGNTFTTQFYGGKSFMKKRFENILTHSKKRNGAAISICAVGLTLVSGMLVGCFAVDNISSGTQAQTQFETDGTVIQTNTPEDFNLQTESPSPQTENQQDIPMVVENDNEQGNPEENMDNAETLEAILQIQEVVEELASAYFSGDINAVKKLLPDSYAWDVVAYEGTGTISDVAIKNLAAVGGQEAGNVVIVTVAYRDSTYEDMFQYLTFELMKQSGGWEIQFYGLEG